MFSGGIRNALSRLRKKREAELWKKFEEDRNRKECELEVPTQRALPMRQEYNGDSKIKDVASFLQNTRISELRSEFPHYGTSNRQCEGANELQISRLLGARGLHQVNCILSKPKYERGQQEPSSLDPGDRIGLRACPTSQAQLQNEQEQIQAQLAEFWAERARARQEYRTAKARRNATAPPATGSARPAQQASPHCNRATR
jgi:hypothetical protein